MKKSLLLIPMMALLLTGCGDDEKEDDSLVNSSPTPAQISDAAINSLASIYKKAVVGVSANVEFSVPNFHYTNIIEVVDSVSQTTKQTKTDVDVKNFGFKLKLDARNLNKPIKDWEAAIVVEDLGATVTVTMNDSKVLADNVTVADIDFGVYFKNKNLYANLSDPELKTTAKSVIGMIFGPSSKETQEYQALVDQYAKDLYLENAVDVLVDLVGSSTEIPVEKVKRGDSGISDVVIIPSELPEEILTELREELPYILMQILGPTSPTKDAFSFTLKNNFLNKVEANFNTSLLPEGTFGADDVNFNISLVANFDDEGLLVSTNLSENFSISTSDQFSYGETIDETIVKDCTETDTTILEGRAEEKITISYPTTAISMPDFSGYEPFVLPTF